MEPFSIPPPPLVASTSRPPPTRWRKAPIIPATHPVRGSSSHSPRPRLKQPLTPSGAQAATHPVRGSSRRRGPGPPSKTVNTWSRSVHGFQQHPPPPSSPTTFRAPPTPPGSFAAKPTRHAGKTRARPTTNRSPLSPPGVQARRDRAREPRLTGRRTPHRRHASATRSSGPLARFSPVLERAGSRVGRRPIAAGDAEWSAAERSALDAARGSTTLTKKRVAQRSQRKRAGPRMCRAGPPAPVPASQRALTPPGTPSTRGGTRC
ncbi:hypothetical protein RKD28_005008 [Streptomyces sp. SAI-229]